MRFVRDRRVQPQGVTNMVLPVGLAAAEDVVAEAYPLPADVRRAPVDPQVAGCRAFAGAPGAFAGCRALAGCRAFAGHDGFDAVSAVRRSGLPDQVQGPGLGLLTADRLRLIPVRFEPDAALLGHHAVVTAAGIVADAGPVTGHGRLLGSSSGDMDDHRGQPDGKVFAVLQPQCVLLDGHGLRGERAHLGA